ncbi:MAG: FAD-dependent monooxygenase, partial [Pseudomonadota bacterium]
VAADGANSGIRKMAAIGVAGKAYDQHALVATVGTGYPQEDITWQRFTPAGPQAFLPLSGPRASMVWYESAETVAALKQLPDEEFLQAMTDAFPQKLGKLHKLYARGSFPLHWQHAEKYVQSRLALVGDAAHTVHPLAGQGVNMGLLDVGALVDCVLDSYRDGKDIGGLRTLRRYERWRQPANELMIRFLDGIQRVFQPDSHKQLMKGVRTAALGGAQHITPINEYCMRTAMGLTGNLPRMARGRLPLEIS